MMARMVQKIYGWLSILGLRRWLANQMVGIDSDWYCARSVLQQNSKTELFGGAEAKMEGMEGRTLDESGGPVQRPMLPIRLVGSQTTRTRTLRIIQQGKLEARETTMTAKEYSRELSGFNAGD